MEGCACRSAPCWLSLQDFPSSGRTCGVPSCTVKVLVLNLCTLSRPSQNGLPQPYHGSGGHDPRTGCASRVDVGSRVGVGLEPVVIASVM